MASSFYYKGVVSFSSLLNSAPIFPTLELSPTTATKNAPSPVKTLVPESNIGEGTL